MREKYLVSVLCCFRFIFFDYLLVVNKCSYFEVWGVNFFCMCVYFVFSFIFYLCGINFYNFVDIVKID